jgi:hypothetical protein
MLDLNTNVIEASEKDKLAIQKRALGKLKNMTH